MPGNDDKAATDTRPSPLPPAGELLSHPGKAEQVRNKASEAQHKAATPGRSVFVNANAGSGKTYLLVNRVIRLLLDGASPENILCITYTRAAATEMRSRLFERLAEWIELQDGDLLQRIHEELDHKEFRRQQLPRARRLFALALETPGGLRVQTIHAFCERLLQAFPVEAGMPPGFEVMDEAEARELLTEARLRLLSGDDDEVRDDLALLATHMSEDDLHQRLQALLSHRRLLARMHDDARFDAFVRNALRETLGIGEDEPADADARRAQWFRRLDRAALASAVEQLQAQPASRLKKTDRDTIKALRALLAAEEAETAASIAINLFLKADGDLRSDKRWLLTTQVRDALPEVVEALRIEERRAWELRQALLAREALRANAALLNVGKHILGLYEAEKARRGKFDYDDLILRTLRLLEGPEGPWVLYRLDGRIDHVLLDEAQDTSPEQWRILRAITEEFTAGEGAEHAGKRTLFAVGDVKQSIYSFQGAAPRAFRAMQAFFQQRFRQANLPFETVPLGVSFRTAQPILKVVDAVLNLPGMDIGEDDWADHASARPHMPGFVELWPLEQADDTAGAHDDTAGDANDDAGDDADTIRHALRELWTPPTALDAELRPRLKLAGRIADTIRRWLDTGEALPPDPLKNQKDPRPIRPRDILILVRNRTTLMEAIISALKQRGIPVAGADRLRVADHIAVQDILALARFLLLPADDLSLAAVLKSPLLARDDGQPVNDDDLLRIRGEQFDFSRPLSAIRKVRAQRPLWDQLRHAARSGAPLNRAVERLEHWRRMAGYLPPYELLAHVLWRDGGLKRFMARLGAEVLEPLEALLDLALRHERQHLPSLAAFIEWISTENPEIRREQEGAEEHDEDDPGEVRVMTVHGAKGLEAPVVFLADTASVPESRKVRLLEAPLSDSGETLPLWPMKSSRRPEPLQALMQQHLDRQVEEYNRLLYVAMTRAADRLYICGAAQGRGGKGKGNGNSNGPAITCWHERIAAVLQHDEYAVRAADGRTIWRYPPQPPECRASSATPPPRATPLPAWAQRPAPEEPGPAVWLSPSRLPQPGADEAPASTDAPRGMSVAAEPVLSPLSLARQRRQPQKDPFRRGVLIHKLLQYLPSLPAVQRTERALDWLTQPAQGLSREQAEELLQEVESVLREPSMAALFGPRSQAEAPFAARLRGRDGQPLLISGQMDRLAVLEDEVIVADFKTSRPIPEGIADIPQGYIRQMALYAKAAEQIWPDRPVRSLLIFTAGPQWFELPRRMLQAASRSLTAGAAR